MQNGAATSGRGPATAGAAGCVFCGIVAGELPAERVFEDEWTLAFLDVAPAAEGHLLVVPKVHAADLLSVSPEVVAAVMRTAQRMAVLVMERLAPEGLTLVQTNGRAGWQDVMHLHVHVVPRWSGDGLVRPWTPRRVSRAKLAVVGARLRDGTDPVDRSVCAPVGG